MVDPDRVVAWLRETLDAAQRDAEAATPGPWSVRPEPDTGENWEIATTGREQRWVIGAEGGGGVYDKPDADHIARHNPAAVLRRIAADREILEWCTEVIGDTDLSNYEQFGSLRDHPQALAVTLAVETIRNLAKGYGRKDGQQ